MHELLQQLPALLGVVVGAVASFVVASIGERARWRRGVGVRWDERRLQAYADYGFILREMYHLNMRIAAQRGLRSNALPIVSDKGLELLTEAESERAARFEAVLLLGDPATVAAARRWHHAIWHLDWFSRGELLDPDEWARAGKEYAQARESFYRVARDDLGITGELPASDPPPWLVARRMSVGSQKEAEPPLREPSGG